MKTENRARVIVEYMLMGLLFFILNCGQNGRDLSTPSNRIIGHWTTEGEYLIDIYSWRMGNLGEKGGSIKDSTNIDLPEDVYQVHLYFMPIDTLTNKGSYVYVVRKGEDTKIQGLFEYRIIEEQKNETEFKLSFWNNYGDTIIEDCVIAKDGKRMLKLTYETRLDFNFISDIQRFIFGVQGLEIGNQMIFEYVNNETKPPEQQEVEFE